jgi:hypothetical protein
MVQTSIVSHSEPQRSILGQLQEQTLRFNSSFKLHRYWFAWHHGPPPVITDIVDEAGHMSRWISDDGEPVDVPLVRWRLAGGRGR